MIYLYLLINVACTGIVSSCEHFFCLNVSYHVQTYNSFTSHFIALLQACVLASQCLLQAGKLEDCSILLEEVMGFGEEALEAAKSTALHIAPPSGSGRHECHDVLFRCCWVLSLLIFQFPFPQHLGAKQ